MLNKMVNNKKTKKESTVSVKQFKYTGMNNEYRATEEYKHLISMIKASFPNMPHDLAENALGIYKANPTDKLMRELETKISNDKSIIEKPKIPENTTLEGCIKVYPKDTVFHYDNSSSLQPKVDNEKDFEIKNIVE